MAFGIQTDDELELWLRPARFAFAEHGKGHRLFTTTKISLTLYLILLEEHDYSEREIAAYTYRWAMREGIGDELAFGKVVFDLANKSGVRLSHKDLESMRIGYARRRCES